VAVSPARFEIELTEQPVSESLRVFNLGDEEVSLEVSVYPWTLDEANRVQIVEPDEQSLDQWMIVNPLRFSIPGGKSQVVRFSIRPRVEPEPGEHRAIIYLTQQVSESQSEETTLRVSFRFGVAIYAWAGEIRREGTLNSVTLESPSDPPAFSLDVSSRGNGHVRMTGQYGVWQADQFPGEGETSQLEGLGSDGAIPPEEILETGFLPSKPVLPGSQRILRLQLERSLAPGDYFLDLNGDLAGSRIDRAIAFTIPEPAVEP